MEEEIYGYFLALTPPGVDPETAKYSAAKITSAVIIGAIKAGADMGMTQDESMKSLLFALKYCSDMVDPKRSIH